MANDTARSAFLAAISKRKIEKCDLPNGTAVYLQEPVTGTVIRYREKVQALQSTGKKELTDEAAVQLAKELLVDMACDQDGNTILEPGDVEAMAGMSMETFKALFAHALRLAGVSLKAIEEAKESLKKAKA